MKLISMTDFVLETFKTSITPLRNIINYANFLKQPLKLEMFVQCDDEGNVLVKPNAFNIDVFKEDYDKLIDKYQKAKEKVWFEDFELISENKISNGFVEIVFLCYNNGNTQVLAADFSKENPKELMCYTIEDLIKIDLTLTQSAIKKIGL